MIILSNYQVSKYETAEIWSISLDVLDKLNLINSNMF